MRRIREREAKGTPINPLLFINWSSVSSLFRGLMWIVAIVLAGVIMIHLLPAGTPPPHHQMHAMH